MGTWDVARRDEQMTITSAGGSIRCSDDEALDLAVLVLSQLGWQAASQNGVQVGDKSQAMDEASIDDFMRRVVSSGTKLRPTRVTRMHLLGPWGPAVQDDPGGPPRRRFTKAPAKAPEPRSTVKKIIKTVAADPAILPDVQLFTDPVDQLEYLVRHLYLVTVPPGQRQQYPMAEYDVMPEFMEDLEHLDGAVSLQQVITVIVDVVSGRAADVNSRKVRPFRDGGGDVGRPQIVRDDGATAWRANVSTGTPAARRIMWWVLPDGRLELARFATHDDVRMPT
jgi:hypothetical protein